MHTNEILKYADNGMLADCSDIVEKDKFSEISLSNAMGSNGTLYAVPKDKDTVGLVYNKEMFDAAGVAYPDESWTWDDLVSASEKIYAATGKYVYMAYADDQLGYWNFVYQAGGYILNEDKTKAGFTQPATEKAMKFYIGLQQNPHNDGGYAVEDFDTVDPALSTNKDLENLTRELRKAGISLCLDFVMNHTASTHRWAMAAKAGDPWFQAYYHLYDDRTIPDQYEQTVPQVFPNTAPGNFTWCEEMHKWVLTTFHDYQWDLNYANPAVFVDMTKSILHLANLGVEVFRIDAVPYSWKQLGTTCRNLPQVHTIVRMLRMVLECVCPAVILKGEVVMAPKELAAYFGTPEKPECHMLYNVSTMVNLWGALASRDTRLLKAQLDALHALPDNCWFVNYLRCHDDIGWGLDEAVENRLGIDPQKHKEYLYHFYEGNFPGSWAKGELYNYDPATGDARSCGTTASLCGVEQALEKGDKTALDYAVKRDLLLHTAMAFLQGFPMLNCGDEIAQLNGWDYKNDPDRVEDSRNLHRSRFNWEDAKQRTRKGTLQNQLWQGMEQLRQMRADPCFAPDAWVTTWDSHNPGVLALVRKRGEETLVGLFNFTEYPAGASLDALGGRYKTADGKTVWLADVELKPYQALLVRR